MAAAANMFSVRIVTADYYMASPLRGLDICQSPLTQLPVKKVPVVRVFGATPAGKRVRAGAGVRAAGAGGVLPAWLCRARCRPSPGSLRTLPLFFAPLAFSPERDRRRRGKKMWVRASAAPLSAADGLRARGMDCAGGGRAKSLSRWARGLCLVPKDEFAGSLEVGG